MAFVNHKQFYSINVQAVCDSDAFITNIVAHWPGSTHDSRIFDNSNIADKLRDGVLDSILLGDSGYACQAYLLTPILKLKNAGEVCYNTAHRHTRCVIERCFGLLKGCFPCLHLGLCTALLNTLIIIVATAVLHNFTLIHREQDFDEDIEDENVPFDIVALGSCFIPKVHSVPIRSLPHWFHTLWGLVLFPLLALHIVMFPL